MLTENLLTEKFNDHDIIENDDHFLDNDMLLNVHYSDLVDNKLYSRKKSRKSSKQKSRMNDKNKLNLDENSEISSNENKKYSKKISREMKRWNNIHNSPNIINQEPTMLSTKVVRWTGSLTRSKLSRYLDKLTNMDRLSKLDNKN